MTRTGTGLVSLLMAAVVTIPRGTPAQEADELYGQFNRFCADHFTAEREPEVYRMFGADLAFEDEALWVHVSERSACVGFGTNLPAKTTIEYGTTDQYGSRTAEPERCFYRHVHYLKGLEAETEYHYRTVAVDERGNKVAGKDRTFTTRAMLDAVRIPGGLEGPPYVLDKENATYLVTEDFSSDGTAIFIAASGITLDLGGHTITYDQKRDTADEGACGVRGHKTRGIGLEKVTVVNGTILQGKGKSSTRKLWNTLYNPIFFKNSSRLELAGITADYHGDQVVAVALIMGAQKADLHHNVFLDGGASLFNRHLGMDVISFGASDSQCHHNLIKRTRHRGVKAFPDNEIHSNEIYIDSYATNSYGIMYYAPKGAQNLNLHGNRIFGTGYHPVGIGSGQGYREVRIHGNYIQMQGSPPEGRWRGGQGGGDAANQLHPVNCIRLQRPAASIEHYDNVFVSRGKGRGCLTRGIWLVPGENTGKGIVFRNNRIKLVAEDAQAEGYAVSAGGAGEQSRSSLVQLTGNTVISNLCHVRFGDNYSHGGRYAFSSNTFVRVGDDPRYQTVRLGWQGWKYESYGHTFTDSLFEGGAGYDKVAFDGIRRGRYDFTVQWTLTAKTEPGAAVTITDRNGKEAFAGKADADGKVIASLAQYVHTREGKVLLTPHTVAVAKEGFRAATKTVTVENKMELAVGLGRE